MEGLIHHLQFRALMSGVRSTPWIFTKVNGEALAQLQLLGIAVIPYLDDLLLFFAPSRERLQQDLARARNHLESLGWILNLPRSIPVGLVSGLSDKFDRTEDFFSRKKSARFSAQYLCYRPTN